MSTWTRIYDIRTYTGTGAETVLKANGCGIGCHCDDDVTDVVLSDTMEDL